MTHPTSHHAPDGSPSAASPVIGWGVVVGLFSAALPALVPWLPPLTVYAVTVAVIAAVYIGFAVADGRAHVLVAESVVATGFILVAAFALEGVTGSLWLVASGLLLHGLKDLWQHKTQFVRNTRWWPPFCVAVDWTAALGVTLVAGVT
jgi:hypothetical protein